MTGTGEILTSTKQNDGEQSKSITEIQKLL